MDRKKRLVLYKEEWERLKHQAGPQEKPVARENQYLKALTEKSQKWVKSWPDTKQGHLAQIIRNKKKQHAKDIAMVKSYANKNKKDRAEEAILKAKQLIFEDSCYGKQLISALTESKTLEERDVQVLFQRESKQKADAEKKLPNYNVHCSFGLDKQQAENHRASRTAALETAEINKEICKAHRYKIAKKYDKEKQNRQEEERIMKQLHLNEVQGTEKHTNAERQAIKEFEAIQKQINDKRAKREELAEILTETNRKHQELINCKIQQVYKDIYEGRYNTTLSMNNYKLIETIQEDEKRRYDDFVEKGIKDYEQRISIKERGDELTEKLKKLSLKQCKLKSEGPKRCNASKLFCDRQSILTKSHKIPLKRGEKGTMDKDIGLEESKLKFLIPSKSLLQELRKRQEEPSPWNGTKAAHAQFAAQADEILRQCAYKNKARKVVDDYMKQNCLDSLPMTNY